MSSSGMQARANALNAKMEGEAGKVLEDIERNLLRKVARESFSCAVKCYDKAGSTGPSNALEHCARNCQVPYQQSQQLVQNVRSIFHLSAFYLRYNIFWILTKCKNNYFDRGMIGSSSVSK